MDRNIPSVVLEFSSDDEKFGVHDRDSAGSLSTEEDALDSLIRDYENFGTTPPRTRILRRERSSKESVKQKSRSRQRHRKISSHEKIITRVISNGKKYINTHLNYLLNGDSDTEGNPDKRKHGKKTMKRFRDSDKFLNTDIDSSSTDPLDCPRTMKVESSNRFLSLSCKLVKTAIQWRTAIPAEGSKSRSDFHELYTSMIRSGNGDKDKGCKRQLSEEESLWQTELKDMIWLELQAWRADRTPTQQDMYLLEARSMIPQLLDDILNYKFEGKSSEDPTFTQSSDSGINVSCPPELTSCSGCLWFFCPYCLENSNKALEQIKSLMYRLEAAESLFPSAKAMGNCFPVCKSNEFVGKLNAMFIWYNITQQLRLKILILAKQLVSYALEKGDKTDISSPGEYQEWDFHTLGKQPIQQLYSLGRYFQHVDSGDTKTYRKFIEVVLKTKGLRKAVFFLESLYLTVLKKGRITLSNAEDLSIEDERFEPDDLETMRFGYWSPEYKSMDLPSFRPAFLFISRIPLDVLHEFLRMRLETKLDKPSALSIRQLIRELKEAISLSVKNKQLFVEHCEVALSHESDDVKQKIYLNYLTTFNASLYSVLKLYLNYIVQWVTLTEQEKVQKNILEEEWKFVTTNASHIPEGECVSGVVFCTIAKTMLCNLATNMKKNLNLKNDETLNGSYRQALVAQCRSLQTAAADMRDKTFRVLGLTRTLIKYLESESHLTCEKVRAPLNTLKEGILELWIVLKERVSNLEDSLSPYLRESESTMPAILLGREVLHRMYKFAFEYVKEVFKLLPDKCLLTREIVEFSRQWIRFVTSHCERGRGVRPRWANYGLDFLHFSTDPALTGNLTEREFEMLKKDVESCVAHIMGAPSTSIPNSPSTIFVSVPRSASPSPNMSRGSSVSTPDSALSMTSSAFENSLIVATTTGSSSSKISRIRNAVDQLDARLKNKWRQAELIGTVVINPENQLERNIKARTVNFPWQRGMKIGHGRFGKVYTAVNTQTGELMAMKEILLQPNDLRTIRKVGLEFKMFEGIQDEYLVKYYGAEVHREELLIFMELCTGGTLESVIGSTENGLPEYIVRRYTLQLVTAICVLHHHSIVHRDIKPANIFLTDEGNHIKLGDFGCAVKIKANSTAPGELKGFVGTQAYMAPEVFMQSTSFGHGRSADIWSLGCVVIEMATGKRPWSEFDSNYQIMFKVGMGETPEVPDNLSEEGQDFVESCVQYNPKNRPTALQLKQHTFLKIDYDEEHLSLFQQPSTLENYLKLGIKR